MESFNTLSLLEKCNILCAHGSFVLSSKILDKHFAIYVLDRKYDYRYAVFYMAEKGLTIEDIMIVDNSKVAEFIDETLLFDLRP